MFYFNIGDLERGSSPTLKQTCLCTSWNYFSSFGDSFRLMRIIGWFKQQQWYLTVTSVVTNNLKQVLQDVFDSVGETVTGQVRRRLDFILVSFPVFTWHDRREGRMPSTTRIITIRGSTFICLGSDICLLKVNFYKLFYLSAVIK